MLPDDVVDSQALERQNHGGQAAPLDLWNRKVRHALLPELLVVYSKAFSSRGSPSSACPLLSLASTHLKKTELSLSFYLEVISEGKKNNSSVFSL